MRLPKYAAIPIIFASGTLSAVAGSENSAPFRQHVTYELLHFDKSSGSNSRDGDVSWSRDDLLREAIEATAASDGEPTIEGWAYSTSYARLYRNREIYLVFAPRLGTPLAQVCRVVVTAVPNILGRPELSAMQAQIYAWSGKTDEGWCSKQDGVETVPTPAQLRAMWPRGHVGSTAVFRATDGTMLTARHIVDLNQLGAALPPANGADILSIGRLPTSLANERRDDRTLQVARIANGGWALSLRYSPRWTNLSGCFITAVNKTDVPSEMWITPELEKWCQDQAARHIASIPLDQRPQAPPRPAGRANRNWADDW